MALMRRRNTEDWVLMALAPTKEVQGVGLLEWYMLRKPVSMKADQAKFVAAYEKLEQDGKIKRTSNGTGYFLTAKGKRALFSIKGQISFADYYDMMSFFPDTEVRERVVNLERLVIYFIGLFGLYIYGTTFVKLDLLKWTSVNDLVYFSVWIILVSILFSYTMVSALEVGFVWAVNSKRRSTWNSREWLLSHKGLIKRGIPMVGAIAFFYSFTVATGQNPLFALPSAVAGLWPDVFRWIRKIINAFYSKLEKDESPSQ